MRPLLKNGKDMVGCTRMSNGTKLSLPFTRTFKLKAKFCASRRPVTHVKVFTWRRYRFGNRGPKFVVLPNMVEHIFNWECVILVSG